MVYADEIIEQSVTAPYAHQTHGTAERVIRTIVTIGLSMLHHAKLNKCFWAEAAMTAIYVKNRLHRTQDPVRGCICLQVKCQSHAGVRLSKSVHAEFKRETTQVGYEGA